MKPRTPALDRKTAMRLAATEYQRCAELLRSLDTDAWAAPTACPAWDVRQMAAHMLGMVEMAASIREGSRQRRAATVNGNIDIDRLTALQVSERSNLVRAAISDRFTVRAPKAVRGRRMTPGFIRRRTMTGGVINGAEEPWTLGYLIDVILTRDPWMHRIDICAALDRTLQSTADHDGVVVADLVGEWADRHGKDFTLHLTGPACGTWTAFIRRPAHRTRRRLLLPGDRETTRPGRLHRAHEHRSPLLAPQAGASKWSPTWPTSPCTRSCSPSRVAAGLGLVTLGSWLHAGTASRAAAESLSMGHPGPRGQPGPRTPHEPSHVTCPSSHRLAGAAGTQG